MTEWVPVLDVMTLAARPDMYSLLAEVRRASPVVTATAPITWAVTRIASARCSRGSRVRSSSGGSPSGSRRSNPTVPERRLSAIRSFASVPVSATAA
jgi:hypothetical protein